jgi:hypothetical protein
MQVTRDIVIDLLPLYQSGEASADTRAAIEEFLRREPGLRKLLEEDESSTIPAAAPAAALEQHTVVRTRATIRRRAWVQAVALLCTLLPFSFAFIDDELQFFMLRDVPGSAALFVAAIVFWVWYARLTRSLRTTGL